jgi:hypothetical protein
MRRPLRGRLVSVNAFAVADAQDELPVGTPEFVNQTFEAIQLLDLPGGNVVKPRGGLQVSLVEAGCNLSGL